MGCRIIDECNRRAANINCKGNVRPVLNSISPVVFVPSLVDRCFSFITACRDGSGCETVDSIPIRVLKPGTQATWVPIAGAANLALKTSGDCRDNGSFVVGDPVAFMIVIELDTGIRTQS